MTESTKNRNSEQVDRHAENNRESIRRQKETATKATQANKRETSGPNSNADQNQNTGNRSSNR